MQLTSFELILHVMNTWSSKWRNHVASTLAVTTVVEFTTPTLHTWPKKNATIHLDAHALIHISDLMMREYKSTEWNSKLQSDFLAVPVNRLATTLDSTRMKIAIFIGIIALAAVALGIPLKGKLLCFFVSLLLMCAYRKRWVERYARWVGKLQFLQYAFYWLTVAAALGNPLKGN